jgi:hypothetical protein
MPDEKKETTPKPEPKPDPRPEKEPTTPQYEKKGGVEPPIRDPKPRPGPSIK